MPVIKRGPGKAELNMTPLIDVTFQLIIFFMLVNNIIAEESVELIPPDLENPKTVALESDNRVVVNLVPESFQMADRRSGQPLAFAGSVIGVKVGMDYFSIDDMNGVTESLQTAVQRSEKNEEGEPLVEVLLRADAAAFYEEVQPVMGAITNAGISKVHLVAYLPEDQR